MHRAQLPLIQCFLLAVLATPQASFSNENLIANSNNGKAKETAEDHWSFKFVQRPKLPRITDKSWPRNEIDFFVLSRCEEAGLKPLVAADKKTFVRRVYYDLLGLPPTPKQVAYFLQDHRPDAHEQLVDRLLASPHYGQKWAQHWLDLARFAETDGFEHDKIRANAWQYRDWVINAFNDDLPYDRFVQLQLAGDELAADQNESVATMFCLSGPDMPDINSQEERRQNVLNEMTGTIGATLLGLQMACAQCHDHKFDPISQKDFYQMRSIFEPSVSVKKNQSLTTLFEKSNEAPKSYLMIRGDWQRQGPEVQPDVPQVLAINRKFTPEAQKSSTGRRTEFTNWVVDRNNPLTSRVIVNRLWQFHFGKGLVESANDFGLMGESPTHPKLLDWLAVELIEKNWSIKHIHRLILNSATYRQQSADGGISENIVGFPRQRLSGETIRDAMLHVSGSIDFAVGGKGVMPPIPEEMKKTLLKNQWNASKNPKDHYRRSIYVFARRNLRYPIFEAFDRPDGNASCPRRNRSTTAPQSLHLLNSEFSLDAARRLAGQLMKQNTELNPLLKEAFERVMARKPAPDELVMIQAFVTKQLDEINRRLKSGQSIKSFALAIPTSDNFDDVTEAAISHLCLALFNTNEFLYID